MAAFRMYFLLLSSLAMPGCSSMAQVNDQSTSNTLSVKGDQFFMNDQPFDMWGIRVASASQSDELTDHLISQLDDYYKYGINTIDVFFQGSSGSFSDPFRQNGNQILEDHLKRMKKIISACQARSMVVIAGIFYQRSMADHDGVRNIKDAEGVKNAVESVAKLLSGYGNVILNIANEQNSGYYKNCEFFNFNDPENIIALCKLAKSVSPDLLVGGGGYHDESNIIIGKSSAVDVLLFDTYDLDAENDQHSQWHYDLFTSKGVKGKPIVNVEMFGGWTRKFMPPGVFPEDGKQKHFKDVDEAAATPGLYVHFHSNPWCQGPSIGKETHYNLGGMGTLEEPGIRWWFEYVQKTIAATKTLRH
ncbi:MAG: hypothetical protein WD824_21815 [Cyclobacteriaceae bacterium]